MQEPRKTLPEKLGASSGAWAVFWLSLHYLILRPTVANPADPADAYVRALLAEATIWDWATAVRVMGGIMIIWFMGSLAGRLRKAEGEPGRLASIAFGLGVVWGAIWLLSAMLNSAGIALATHYDNPEGARLAGALAAEIVVILTPSITFTLSLAVAFVVLRYGGFPKLYGQATAAICVLLFILTVVEWYGPGNLGSIIMAVAFAWIAVTSVLLVPGPR